MKLTKDELYFHRILLSLHEVDTDDYDEGNDLDKSLDAVYKATEDGIFNLMGYDRYQIYNDNRTSINAEGASTNKLDLDLLRKDNWWKNDSDIIEITSAMLSVIIKGLERVDND